MAEEQALIELAELAARMKENGLLDLLRVLADNYDDLVERLSGDAAVKGALLASAAARGVAGSPAEKAEPVLEECTRRLVEALATLPEAAGEVGLVGFLEALREPEVRRGLGVLLHLARALGGCARAGR